uniref:7TM_GPCR_Srx domain-containing protein n=1 Tax=Strongyloides papillosus TaxID=174720 RepID=A0A0N5C3A3_STREA
MYDLKIINLLVYSELFKILCNIMLAYNIIGIELERFFAIIFVKRYEYNKCSYVIFTYHIIMICFLIFSLKFLHSWNDNSLRLYRIINVILEIIGLVLLIKISYIYIYYIKKRQKYYFQVKRYLSTRYQGKENIDIIGSLLQPLGCFFSIGIIYTFCTTLLPLVINIPPMINLSFSILIGLKVFVPFYILFKKYDENFLSNIFSIRFKKTKVVPEIPPTQCQQVDSTLNLDEGKLHFKYLNAFWEDAYKSKK